MTLDEILRGLFPSGHEVKTNAAGIITGTGKRKNGDAIAVIGVANGEALGTAGVLPLAEEVLRVVAIARSFCPCRAGNGSSLPMASVFWLHGPHSPCGATGDRPILEGPGSGRCCCFHGSVDARPGYLRRNDHGSAAS